MYASLHEPKELKIWYQLNSRMTLSPEDKHYFLNLEKGYIGEKNWIKMLQSISENLMLLNNLLFEHNNTLFQIDSLLVYHNQLYLFEVKNYEGEFYVDSDRWYNLSGKEIKNPTHQLSRCETLFRQLLQQHGINLPIKAYLIFINPEFTLFQAPINQQILLPTQLNRFLKQLKNISFKPTKKLQVLAEKIIAMQKAVNPYMKLPNYDYNLLQKGITCKNCYNFLSAIIGNRYLCEECGQEELIDSAVLREITNLRMLFPDVQLTTNTILEWCDVIPSPKTVRRILNKHYIRKGYGKYSYYVDQEEL